MKLVFLGTPDMAVPPLRLPGNIYLGGAAESSGRFDLKDALQPIVAFARVYAERLGGELARRHDGAFGWASGMNVSYGTTGHGGGRSWGNLVPLIYTIPRKQLRIYGAPRTQFSKPYQLPKRPWGNEADEAFYSLEPGEYAPEYYTGTYHYDQATQIAVSAGVAEWKCGRPFADTMALNPDMWSWWRSQRGLPIHW